MFWTLSNVQTVCRLMEFVRTAHRMIESITLRACDTGRSGSRAARPTTSHRAARRPGGNVDSLMSGSRSEAVSK